jgi:iron(III) transport system ATP-binding protein
MSDIKLHQVAKRFSATPVLSNVDLTVPDGSLTAVLGASGSGKTTLLRLIAGFEQIDAGTVAIGGHVVDDGRRSIRAQHRGVGYVPQEGALFPHLTVKGNIGFGLPRAEHHKVAQLVDLVGLSGLERRYPHQLSGGQQQRVALARALAIQPKVVLLDEPFSSLDASLRYTLRRDVIDILAQTGTTTILVTHDQDEALALADQIAVLRKGNVVATADPRTLYSEPPDITAASFIGEANILAAHVQADQARCVLGTIRLHTTESPATDGPSRLLLRPEQLILHSETKENAINATVVEFQYHGHDALVHVAIGHPNRQILLSRISGDLALTTGQSVWVEVRGTARAWPLTNHNTNSKNHTHSFPNNHAPVGMPPKSAAAPIRAVGGARRTRKPPPSSAL